MASPNQYPSGLNLAGTVFAGGPTIAQLTGDYFSGSVQWLDTINGNNANSGGRPELAVKTLAQAVTNSTTSGIIVIGAGSAETLAGSQSLAIAHLMIIGCGSGSSMPRYTCSGAVDMFSIASSGVRIRNLYFPASTAAATSRIKMNSTSAEVKDCFFECGANDTGRAVNVTSSSARVRGCTFLSTASRPAIGLEVSGIVNDTLVESCTFDGGSFGWSDYAFKVSAAAVRSMFEGVNMIHQSDFGATVTGTGYHIFGLTTDGSSNVNITA